MSTKKRGTDLVEQWIRPQVRALSAYQVPDPGDLIKLDAMENPYGWPEALVDEWLESLRNVSLNRYPDPDASQLTQRLRQYMEVPGDSAILLGNGSDELIQLILLALAAPGRGMLAPDPTFAMYRQIAVATSMGHVAVPLDGDFELDAAAMLDAIEKHQPAVVFIAYPNNPTGNLFATDAVDAVIDASPGLVVIDEAYTAFAGASYMPQLKRCNNLLVMRTVSKLGLAGLRLGLLAGAPEWLDEIGKLRLPYNINILTQVSADFALSHQEVFTSQTKQICTDRELLYERMRALDGITVYPSRSNFILFRTRAGRAATVYEAIRAHGVLIKTLDGKGPLQDCLRVTVGTHEENEVFLAGLAAAL